MDGALRDNAAMRARIVIPPEEMQLTAVRSAGAGGQNVNKVASAVHLRFDVHASSLPADVKARLLALDDRRLTRDGVIVIKSQVHRSQDMNRDEAISRLHRLVRSVAVPPRARKPTKPTRASRERRMEGKARRGRIKALRGKVAAE
jgi:ribosome-associated protein